MTAFTTVRTARKPKRCSRCLGLIPVGTSYVAVRIPPGGELGYLGWVSGAEHEQTTPGRCAPSGRTTP